MGNFQEVYASRDVDLKANEAKLTEALGNKRGPDGARSVPSAMMGGGLVQVTIRDGKETVTTHTKPLNGGAVNIAAPLRPGHVILPGIGETTIAAAIRSGLLPQGWTPEKGFDQPAEGKAGNLAGTNDNAARSNDAPKEAQGDDLNVTPAMKASVAEAGRILDQVDQMHGAELTTRYMAEIAESGTIPTEGLPEGVTAATAQKVYDGFVAQCNASLAEVGSSVSMLEAMLDDNQLRIARQAALRQNSDVIKQLGEIARGRLAKLPETDPEAFAELLEGMSKEERAALRRNPQSGQWTVGVGQQEMSFGLAVRRGIVRF